MRVSTYLWHNDIKGQLPQPDVCCDSYHQSTPIAYYSLLFKTIENTISMNTDTSKLPLYTKIGMNRCYKYFIYQHPLVIVYSVSLNKKLIIYYYLHLPRRSVSSPGFAEYGSKWAPLAMIDMFRVYIFTELQSFSLSELL